MEAHSNPQRIAAVREQIASAGLDAVICTLPANILMLTGYWPVVGTSIAIATRLGHLALLVPQDERDLLDTCWVDDVTTFAPSSLSSLRPLAQTSGEALAPILRRLGISRGSIGHEFGPASEPSSYAAMNLYGGSILELIRIAAPDATLVIADPLLAELTANKTPLEVSRIRRACEVTAIAFEHAARELWVGMRETEAVTIFSAAFHAAAAHIPRLQRSGAFFFCMSGPDAARASAAYARSRRSVIESGETVLIHCNTHAEGYWTDITRTYIIGEPTPGQRRWYEAVFAAREAALAAIHPGARCSDVDRAARSVLEDRGYGAAFRHSTGHGVGFAAISANARPRIHPKSEEILREGMVFNLEPAVYFDGIGGVRHCDMVAVTQTGAEVLTPFHQSERDLLLNPADSMLRTG